MDTFIISDVHLASRYCLCEEFVRFLRTLPVGSPLVLNGDTVSRRHRHMPAAHREALDLLREESLRRQVVWIRGNHDRNYVLDDPGNIEFRESFSVAGKILVTHGHEFDLIKLFKRLFVIPFLFLHNLSMWFGAESVHVAFYAKRFPRLYGIFREYVAGKAVGHARDEGYSIVACGHTHYVEDRYAEGVRYINTGAWTERPICYLRVGDGEISLKRIPESEC